MAPPLEFALFEDDARFYEGEDSEFDELALTCFPQRKARPPGWWATHPTLGVWCNRSAWNCDVCKMIGPHLIAYTSFTLAPGVIFFYDLAVSPVRHRQGLGRALHAQRLLIGEAFGCTLATGVTQADNRAMVHLFEVSEFQAGQVIEGHYMDLDPPQDGIPYVGVEPSFKWAHSIRPCKE